MEEILFVTDDENVRYDHEFFERNDWMLSCTTEERAGECIDNIWDGLMSDQKDTIVKTFFRTVRDILLWDTSTST